MMNDKNADTPDHNEQHLEMVPTPRTDAWTTYNGVPGIEYVYATIARTLERELADLRSQLELASPKTQIISEPNSPTAFSLNP